MHTTILVPISAENLRDALKKRIALLRVEANREFQETAEWEADMEAERKAAEERARLRNRQIQEAYETARADRKALPWWERWNAPKPALPWPVSEHIPRAFVTYTYPKANELLQMETELAGVDFARDTCYISAELAARLNLKGD